MSGGEWLKLFYDVVDHERIAGADLSHIPLEWREDRREAMFGLYVRALRDLQRARSNDGLLPKPLLWGPAEARRAIAEELERVGMLEVREGRYYPRNYLEKNRSGDAIRKAAGAVAGRQQTARALKAAEKAAAKLAASLDRHADVTRDASVTPVSASLSVSEDQDRKGDPITTRATEPPPSEPGGVILAFVAAASSTKPPADIPITPELEAACEQAGVPKPTRAHVLDLLAHRRTQGRGSCDWTQEVVRWMRKQQQFERERPPDRRNILQRDPGEPLWKIGREI